MTHKARIWIGFTVLMVLGLNYVLIGFPLMSKSSSIQQQTKSILTKQAKSDTIFKNATDEYMLDILQREKSSLDRKFLIVNCVAISCLIIIASWVGFGLITHKDV